MGKDDRPTVYSTEWGDQRKQKDKPTSASSLSPSEQTAYLHRETKGRGGKVVSVVRNLQLSDKDLKDLSRKLKAACGTGGTIKDGMIEIQGEHREKIAAILQNLGYKTRVAGG